MQTNDFEEYKKPFLVAARQHLTFLENGLELVKTSKNPENILNDLYLHLHSLKGEINAMGFDTLGETCEKALVILKAEKDHPSSSIEVFNNILGIIESLKKPLDEIEGKQL